MDCPNCGTYNPEDRTVCWRCNKELPKTTPPKKRNPQKTAQLWLYIAIAIFFVITILQTCGVKLPFGPQTSQQGPASHILDGPVVVYTVRSAELPWIS